MSKIAKLNHLFGITNQLKFEVDANGLVMVNIDNEFAEASLCLQGAHLLSWIPKMQKPVIWLSDNAIFSKNKSIRGGVPICWPWFGAHQTEKKYPAHGFARTQEWKPVESLVMPDGRTCFTLQLFPNEITQQFWKYEFELRLQVIVGKKLEMILITKNMSDQVFSIGQAFHTYFNVSNINQVSVQGLENVTFIDALEDWKRKSESDPITINAEIDRIYLDAGDDCIIKDLEFMRSIRISKTGSKSTVVWNPWIEKSIRMGDMGEDGYKNMVCVETTNATEDVVSIAPGEEHQMSVCYQLES